MCEPAAQRMSGGIDRGPFVRACVQRFENLYKFALCHPVLWGFHPCGGREVRAPVTQAGAFGAPKDDRHLQHLVAGRPVGEGFVEQPVWVIEAEIRIPRVQHPFPAAGGSCGVLGSVHDRQLQKVAMHRRVTAGCAPVFAPAHFLAVIDHFRQKRHETKAHGNVLHNRILSDHRLFHLVLVNGMGNWRHHHPAACHATEHGDKQTRFPEPRGAQQPRCFAK